jgi:hypothetical protein
MAAEVVAAVLALRQLLLSSMHHLLLRLLIAFVQPQAPTAKRLTKPVSVHYQQA